jgi:RNA polymerase sigma factor (sigma-70 family)
MTETIRDAVAERLVNDPDTTIAAYNGWLYQTAAHMLDASSPNLDDLVQEGRLAMWLALSSFDPAKGSLPSWLTRKAKFRMLEVVSGRRYTGAPKRLHGSQPVEKPYTVSLDAERGDGVSLKDSLTTGEPEEIERAGWAYHQAEIRAAIDALSPAQRKYVLSRFWDGSSGTEMQDDGLFGYDPSALWTSRKNGAREKLREALAHLEEMR